MGFWANLLTHKKTRQQQFQDAAAQIRQGLLARLERRYRAEDEPSSDLLAAAVTSTLFCEPTPEPDIRHYLKSNGKKVGEAVRALADDTDICRTLTAFFRVIGGIRRRQPDAFVEDFAENPLDALRGHGLLVDDEPEPLIDDFLRMAGKFSAPR